MRVWAPYFTALRAARRCLLLPPPDHRAPFLIFRRCFMSSCHSSCGTKSPLPLPTDQPANRPTNPLSRQRYSTKPQWRRVTQNETDPKVEPFDTFFGPNKERIERGDPSINHFHWGFFCSCQNVRGTKERLSITTLLFLCVAIKGGREISILRIQPFECTTLQMSPVYF